MGKMRSSMKKKSKSTKNKTGGDVRKNKMTVK
jgi:hypothetical protein